MQTLARVVLRHPLPIISAAFVLCLGAQLVHSRYQAYDFSFESMAPRETVAYHNFKEFEEVFGTDEALYLIVFRADDVLDNQQLDRIRRITERIEALPETQSITSIVNARDILGRDGVLEVSEFVAPPEEAGYALTAEQLERLESRLTGDPVVGGSLLSRDARTTALVGRLGEYSKEPRDRVAYFDSVGRILAEEGAGQVEFHVTGIPYLDGVMMSHIENDTVRFIPLTMLLLGALVYLAFRQLRAVWMAILPPTMAAVLTLGLLSALGWSMTVLTGEGVLATLILVVGLSDAVHMLNRYGEEVRTEPGRQLPARLGAVSRTMRAIGRACFLTSATTAVGFCSLAAADIPTIRQFGVLGGAGILFAYLGAIVVMPATMVVAERMRPSRAPASPHAGALDRALQSIASLAIAWPRTVSCCGVALFVAAAAASTNIVIDNRFTEDLKPDDPAVVALRFVEEHLGGTYPLEVVVRGDGPDSIKDPRVLRGIDHVRRELEALPHVSKVSTPVEYVRKMNRALHDGAAEADAVPDTREAVAQNLLLFEMGGGDGEFDRLVDYDYEYARLQAMMRDIDPATYYETIELLNAAVEGRFPDGVEVYESGGEPLFYTASERLMSTLVRSLYLAMPLILLITAAAFRSFKLAAISILPNVIPITVGLGMMGVADISLRFATIVGFPVAFGLAIDDTIHFLARYRSEVRAGASIEDAVRRTLATTGRAMVLTTMFLVAGYAVMFSSEFLAIIHMSWIVVVILAAALVGDLLLLPALLVWLRPRLSS